MKTIYYFLLASITPLITACTSDFILDLPDGTAIPDVIKADIDNMRNIEEMDVPVQPGMVTVVTINGDTMCTTDQATTILVPKGTAIQLATRALLDSEDEEGTQITYVPLDKWVGSHGVNNGIYQFMCFEDTENGDYDYNDVVFHFLENKGNQALTCTFKCIAMGGTKKLALGVDSYSSTDKGKTFTYHPDLSGLLFNDIRKEFFPSHPNGFINTERDAEVVDASKTIQVQKFSSIGTMPSGGLYTNYYIQLEDGTKLYCIPQTPSNATETNCLDGRGRPYGFTLYNTGASATGIIFKKQKKDGTIINEKCGGDVFNWPEEYVPIQYIYPNFDKWVMGKATKFIDYTDLTGYDGMSGNTKYWIVTEDENSANHASCLSFPEITNAKEPNKKAYPAIQRGLSFSDNGKF